VLGLIGKKVGMTQVFDEGEQLIPLTVVEAGPCPVVQVKTGDSDGYSALKVAYGDVKEQRLTKPQKGIFEKTGVKPHASSWSSVLMMEWSRTWVMF